MFNFGYITKEDIKEHNPNWPEILEHPYKILIAGGSESGKTIALLNLINHESDIDKIYLYAKDPYERKYQLLINKTESAGRKYCNDSKAFIEYSNDMDNIYKNIEEFNPNKKRKLLIIFDDMIAVLLSNKKLNPIVTELFIKGKKLNISLVFITQSYFAFPKIIRLNSTHYFVIKFPNIRELQQIAFNHSSNIDFQDFMNLYKKCYSYLAYALIYFYLYFYKCLVIYTTLASDNPLRFRKNLLERI